MTDILPDSEGLLVGFLAAHPLLTPLTGPRVATVIQPGWTGLCLRVSRVGGTLLSRYADHPRLQIDCWSSIDDASGADAANLALTVAAALPDLAGQHGTAFLANVDIVDGPLPEADDNGRPRYRIDVTAEVYGYSGPPPPTLLTISGLTGTASMGATSRILWTWQPIAGPVDVYTFTETDGATVVWTGDVIPAGALEHLDSGVLTGHTYGLTVTAWAAGQPASHPAIASPVTAV